MALSTKSQHFSEPPPNIAYTFIIVSMSRLRNSGMISSPINNIRKAGLTDCNCRHVVQLCHSISVGVEKSQVEGVFGDDCQEKSLTTWTNVSAWNQHLERYIYTWNVKYDYDSYSYTLQGLSMLCDNSEFSPCPICNDYFLASLPPNRRAWYIYRPAGAFYRLLAWLLMLVWRVWCPGQVSCSGYNDPAGDMVTAHATTTAASLLSNMSCALLNQTITQIFLRLQNIYMNSSHL